MTKKDAKKPQQRQTGFFLFVDGREYGPFLEKHRSEFSDLKHKKGVSFTAAAGRLEWVTPPQKEKHPKKESGVLFDMEPYSTTRKGWAE